MYSVKNSYVRTKTNKMIAEIKKKWLEKLTIETQCTKNLRIGSSYCVLGCLCALHSEETNTEWELQEERGHYRYLGNVATIPEEVLKWSKVKLDNRGEVSVAYKGEYKKLHELNDLGITFKQLSKIIQEQL